MATRLPVDIEEDKQWEEVKSPDELDGKWEATDEAKMAVKRYLLDRRVVGHWQKL